MGMSEFDWAILVFRISLSRLCSSTRALKSSCTELHEACTDLAVTLEKTREAMMAPEEYQESLPSQALNQC